MTSQKYILTKDHEIKEEHDLLSWAKWFESIENRRVGWTIIGKTKVSTVFLGLDYNFGPGAPLLFETMVFGGKRDEEQYRYTTWKEAEKGHKKVVASLKS